MNINNTIKKLFCRAPEILIVPVRKLDKVREDIEDRLADRLEDLLANDKTKDKLSSCLALGVNAGLKSVSGMSLPDEASDTIGDVLADILVKSGYCAVRQMEK